MSIINGHARWAFDLIAWKPSLQDLKIAVSLIQPEEKSRLMKFVFLEDFKSSLAGRLLLRYFVRQALCVDNHQFRLGRDGKNKPYLMQIDGVSNADNKVIDFNASHQGGFACVAGFVLEKTEETVKMKIGCDVMKIEHNSPKPLSEFLRLMGKNFSENELRQINSFNSNIGKLEAFMRNWCLKESYVKNIGTGISLGLRKLNFIISTDELSPTSVVTDSKIEVEGILQENFMFEESLIGSEHCVAVSLQNQPADSRHEPFAFKLIKFEELIENATPISEPDEKYCIEVLRKNTKS